MNKALSTLVEELKQNGQDAELFNKYNKIMT